jgi:uncharacterized protein (TIGR03067 family)
MMIKALALVAGAMVWGGAVAAPAADKDDAKALDGTWQVVSQTTDGKQDVIAKDAGDMVVVSGGRYTVKQGDREVCSGTFTLDATKTPMTIDNAVAEGDDKGKTARGIYRVAGDEVKVSWSRPGETDRPAGFDAKSYRLTTLKRVK